MKDQQGISIALTNFVRFLAIKLRDTVVVFFNLEDYLVQDIFSWQPEMMLMSRAKVVC